MSFYNDEWKTLMTVTSILKSIIFKEDATVLLSDILLPWISFLPIKLKLGRELYFWLEYNMVKRGTFFAQWSTCIS